MNKLIKGLLLFGLLLTVILASAQLPGGINIDQLTDQQLMQYAQSSGLMGLSDAELEAKAKEKGLSADQIQKLKARMQALNPGDQKQDAKKEENSVRKPVTNITPKSNPDYINGLMIFGSDFFTKENLTFEPNLNIPTPRNYTIGGGDELKIDIYGFSDKSQTLKVTPDGFIRYPNIGPIKLAGLSFDEAKTKLTNELSRIYPGLKSGSTSLQLTLGQIRTIKVNLIGEITKPGSYSVSSLSTIANALYAAGGPTRIGSYRNIELVRGGKVIAKFDLYDYLLKGDLSANKVLQDDDVIKVATYTSRVELRGSTKRAAIYELTANDKLTDLLKYSGGLSDNANKSFFRVNRFGKQEKEVMVVKSEDANAFVLQTGDQLYIDSLSNIYKNRLSISGAVNYEGVYSLETTPTLKELISIAKPKDDASKERAILRRLKYGYIPEMIGFNLDDVLNGSFNLPLQKEDSIHIYSNKEIKDIYQITVKGEVNKPENFLFARGMQVQDAVLLAGGYKDGASRKLVEVARRIRDTSSATSSPQYAIILSADLSAGNNPIALSTLLEPFDIVAIRKAPGYKEQMSVSIEGEVQLPGSYTISSNQERLSDLVKRVGGIKEGGFPEGAFLLRKTFEGLIPSDTVILKNKLATLKSTFTDTLKAKQADSLLKGDMKMVGIRLEEVIKTPGSLYDVILEDGDIIKVPKKIETVQTFSGVYFPKKIVYRDGLSLKQVIRESGGVLPGGQRKKSYVVYPNGEVRSTKSFLFVRSYPTVKPGSEIYVPVKELKKGGTSAAEIVALSTGLATLFLIIKSL
jgi:protein involved in polysaccharide export with SLBB domain